MIQKFSHYEFEVKQELSGWLYAIYDPDYKPSPQTVIREGNEFFESPGHARLAAIGHISLLENGEG